MDTKRNSFFLCLVMSGLFTHSVMAADSTVNVTGNVVATPCEVDGSAKNTTVDFGNIPAATLTKPGDWTPTKVSSITLANCPATTTSVVATYTGTADKNNPIDFASSGVAKNISIEMKSGTAGGSVLSNGSTQTVTVDAASHTATLPFRVWVGNSSPTATPAAATPGSIIGTVQVAFSYK